jgi:hypothetical protein
MLLVVVLVSKPVADVAGLNCKFGALKQKKLKFLKKRHRPCMVIWLASVLRNPHHVDADSDPAFYFDADPATKYDEDRGGPGFATLVGLAAL